MGRGRAKAKQTKVARELKYSSPATDFEALQRELSGSSGSERSDDERAADEDYEDGYDDYRR
jgi:cell division septum initiation protein DivIVA